MPQGGKGPVRGEQDDEILDQIRAGRGLDTGGELLGRQRAGGGIGSAIARRLALEGSLVVVTDVNEEAAREVVKGIEAEGGAAVVYSADLDEILALTQRIVVCFDGRVREIPPPADSTDRGAYARALVGADA